MGEFACVTIVGMIAVGAVDAAFRLEAVAAVNAVFAIKEPVTVEERFTSVAALT